jgi:hypothetical protein
VNEKGFITFDSIKITDHARNKKRYDTGKGYPGGFPGR